MLRPVAVVLVLSVLVAQAYDVPSFAGNRSTVLPPPYQGIKYVETTLQAPGYIDLSDLRFDAIDSDHEDDLLIDVVILPKRPNNGCINDYPICWLQDAGVGKFDAAYNPHWCCWENEIRQGLCTKDQLGQFFVRAELATKWQIQVGDSIPNGKTVLSDRSGTFAVVFASCNPNHQDRPVQVHGTISVKSAGDQPVNVSNFVTMPEPAPEDAYSYWPDTTTTLAPETTTAAPHRPEGGSEGRLIFLCVLYFLVGLLFIDLFWKITRKNSGPPKETKDYDGVEITEAFRDETSIGG